MKLLLDMHLSIFLAEQLRREGCDAFQLRERGLGRLADVDILALAKQEQRIVVTFDLDFSALLAHNGDRFPSVIQFRTDDARTEEVGRILTTILPIHAAVLEQGCILTIESDRIRIRLLPIS